VHTPSSSQLTPPLSFSDAQGVPLICNLLLAHLAWRYLHSTYLLRGKGGGFVGYRMRPVDAESLGRGVARAVNAVADVHAHLFAGSNVNITVKVCPRHVCASAAALTGEPPAGEQRRESCSCIHVCWESVVVEALGAAVGVGSGSGRGGRGGRAYSDDKGKVANRKLGISGGRSLTRFFRHAHRCPSTRWYPVLTCTRTTRKWAVSLVQGPIFCRPVPNLM
jgi:hypothetical protein